MEFDGQLLSTSKRNVSEFSLTEHEVPFNISYWRLRNKNFTFTLVDGIPSYVFMKNLTLYEYYNLSRVKTVCLYFGTFF